MNDNKQLSELEQSMLDAIAIISTGTVKQSKNPVTIECEVYEIEDAGQQLYKVKYRDNIFTASSSSGSYNVGDVVYVHVPEGDFSKTKIILGAVESIENKVEDEIIDDYIEIGDNILDGLQSEYDLCSYTEGGSYYEYNLDTSNFKTLLMKNVEGGHRSFTLSANMKTELAPEQQYAGNYGIQLTIPVLYDHGLGSFEEQPKTQEDEVIINLDKYSIQGNPYGLTEYTNQSIIYTLPSNYNLRDSGYKIRIFEKDFPITIDPDNEKTTEDQRRLLEEKDIHIKNISVKIADAFTDEQKTGYNLVLNVDTGQHQVKNSKETKTLIPNLYINGKKSKVNEIYRCYWFKEQSGIKPGADGYLYIGGLNWYCLNEKINVEVQPDGTKTFDYKTDVYTWEVSQKDVLSSQRYKCVLINPNKDEAKDQDRLIPPATITLINEENDITCELVSATQSTVFSKDFGIVDLIAKIAQSNLTTQDKINLIQSRTNKDGSMSLSVEDFETKEIKQQVEEIKDEQGQVIERIGHYEERINFPTSLVEDMNEIFCTFNQTPIVNNVAQNERTIGTASIKITTEEQLDQRATIINGDVLYKYDGDGNSPFVADYAYPYTNNVILPISYRLFKPGGIELTENEYKYCEATWYVPIDSMIIPKKETGKEILNDGEYYIIKESILNYDIAALYNARKDKNFVKLKVKFLGCDTEVTETANIKMVKEGESGTNGSKYTAVITYKAPDGQEYYSYEDRDGTEQLKRLQLTYIDGKGWYYNSDGTAGGTLKPFASDNLILDFGFKVYCDAGQIDKEAQGSDKDLSVKQSIFDSQIENGSVLEITEDNTVKLKNDVITGADYPTVLQGEICVGNKGESLSGQNQQIIYCYYPVEICYVKAEADKTLSSTTTPYIADGYTKVLYASDGTNPQFDSDNPFRVDNSIKTISEYAKTWIPAQSSSDNIKIKQTKDNTCQATPNTKLDNGENLNYIKAILSPSQEQAQALENREAELTIESTELKVIINNLAKYQNGKKIDTFYDKIFKLADKNSTTFNEIREGLNVNQIKNFLSQRIKILDAIENLIDWLEKNKDDTVDDNYTDLLKTLINRREALQKISEETPDNIDAKIQEIQILDPETFEPKQKVKAKLAYDITLDNKINDGIERVIQENTLSAFKSYRSEFNVGLATFKATARMDTKVIGEDGRKKFIYADEVYATQIQKLITLLNDCDSTEFQALSSYGLFQDLVNYDLFYTSSLVRLYSPQDILTTEEKAKANTDPETYIDTLRTKYAGLYPLIRSYEDTILLIDTLEKIFVLSGQDQRETKEYYKQAIQDLYKTKLEQKQKVDDELDKVTEAIEQIKKSNIQLMRPIVMLFNTYEMSDVVGQDGSKLYVDKRDPENPQYLYAPKLGAGIKNDKNQFTGMVMGMRNLTKDKVKATQVGLFGYSEGRQSLFLNADDGSAIFGMSGSGQIVIDPKTNKGLIYSSTYQNDFDNTGKPSSYSDSNKSGEGMLIDLTTPEIRFGNGNFVVTPEGHLTALGGGKIGGQLIKDTTLESDVDKSKGKITLDSGCIKLDGYYCTAGIKPNPEEDEIVELSVYVYVNSNNSKTVKQVKMRDENNKEHEYSAEYFNTTNILEVTIDEEKKRYYPTENLNDDYFNSHKIIGYSTINENEAGKIYSHSHTDLNSTSKGFYLSKDGLSIGSSIRVQSADGGKLYVGRLPNNEDVSPSTNCQTINGDSGHSYIAFGGTEQAGAEAKDAGDTTAKVYLGTDGISIGKRFSVSPSGEMNAYKGIIGGQTLDGKTLVGEDSDGCIILDAAGAIAAKKKNENNVEETLQSIDRQGDAIFNNITCTDIFNISDGTNTQSNTDDGLNYSFNGAIGESGNSQQLSNTAFKMSDAENNNYMSMTDKGLLLDGKKVKMKTQDGEEVMADYIENLAVGSLSANYVKTSELNADIANIEDLISMQRVAILGSGLDPGTFTYANKEVHLSQLEVSTPAGNKTIKYLGQS